MPDRSTVSLTKICSTFPIYELTEDLYEDFLSLAFVRNMRIANFGQGEEQVLKMFHLERCD